MTSYISCLLQHIRALKSGAKTLMEGCVAQAAAAGEYLDNEVRIAYPKLKLVGEEMPPAPSPSTKPVEQLRKEANMTIALARKLQ
jgi:hypothetical protein